MPGDQTAHFGVDVGAQTTANDSGSILWKPEWVWRSTEDMKHDWVGCVWIWERKNEITVRSNRRGNFRTHPSVIRLRSSVKLITNSSSSIVHVSLVECCFGINSVVTTNLLFLSFPSSNPQVSLFRAVLTAATLRNLGSDSRGR